MKGASVSQRCSLSIEIVRVKMHHGPKALRSGPIDQEDNASEGQETKIAAADDGEPLRAATDSRERNFADDSRASGEQNCPAEIARNTLQSSGAVDQEARSCQDLAKPRIAIIRTK